MGNGETVTNGSGQQKTFATQLAKASVCYCFFSWIAPIPNPLISKSGFPKVTTSMFGWTETEKDSGDEFWNAVILMKFYDPNTNQIYLTVPQIIPLAHNSYTRSRSRTLKLKFSLRPLVWPPWPPWPAPTGGAVNTGSQALASVNLQECSSCP